MMRNRWFLASVLSLGITLLSWTPISAAELRYHYVPVDPAGNTQLTPVARAGCPVSPGERVRFLGLVQEPATTQPRPTHLVTFRHSFTGRNITVPLTLQPGTPRVSMRRESVLYNYGSESITVEFLKDGSVDVIYSSGLMRRI